MAQSSKWRWYEVLWLLLIGGFGVLVFLSALTALGEHEFRAAWILFGTAVVCCAAFAAILVSHYRNHSESPSVRKCLIGGIVAVALFIGSLLIRTDYSIQKKDIRKYATTVQKYDGTTQAGNEVLTKLEKEPNSSDALTFSIYDVCIGKISHRVQRDGITAPQQIEIVNRKILTEKIKNDAKEMGADVVGITELDPKFILARDNDGNPVTLNHKYAIVLGKGLNYRLSSPTAPLPWQDQYASLPEEVTAALSGLNHQTSGKYSPEAIEDVRNTLEFFHDGGRVAVELAAEIRSFGYPARAHFGRWSEVQVLPLAVEAGLGEIGKNGMLINAKFGPRGSFPVVTTDLPLIPDSQEDLGIQEFCRRCNKCARSCPVQAIPSGEPMSINGLLKWPLDGQKCWGFIKDNPKCMACMGACPYNKKDELVHRLATWLIARKSVVADVLLVKLDDVLGYGRNALAFKASVVAAANAADKTQSEQREKEKQR